MPEDMPTQPERTPTNTIVDLFKGFEIIAIIIVIIIIFALAIRGCEIKPSPPATVIPALEITKTKTLPHIPKNHTKTPTYTVTSTETVTPTVLKTTEIATITLTSTKTSTPTLEPQLLETAGPVISIVLTPPVAHLWWEDLGAPIPECHDAKPHLLPCLYRVEIGDNYPDVAEKFYSDQNYFYFLLHINRTPDGVYQRLMHNIILYIPSQTSENDNPYRWDFCVKDNKPQPTPCFYSADEGETFNDISLFMFYTDKYADHIRKANAGIKMTDKGRIKDDRTWVIVPSKPEE